jgi:hypothetical protein
VEVERRFVDLVTHAEHIEFADIDGLIGQRAGELRARYNLQLPDAL